MHSESCFKWACLSFLSASCAPLHAAALMSSSPNGPSPVPIQIVAQSLGLTVDQRSAKLLACDVEYRMREVIQEAAKFMRHSGRTSLQVDDVNHALQLKVCSRLGSLGITPPVTSPCYGTHSLRLVAKALNFALLFIFFPNTGGEICNILHGMGGVLNNMGGVIHSTGDVIHSMGGAGLLIRTQIVFFLSQTALKDSAQGPPTANRQPPPTVNRQPLPTPTNHQPRTANRHPLKSRSSHVHEAESVPVNVRFYWRYESFSFVFPLQDSPGEV